MSSATARPDGTSQLPMDSVVLQGVSWDLYERILNEVESRLRHAYDNGVLEIANYSFRHQRHKKLLSRLFHVVTEEFDVAIISGGSLTLDCRKRLKGISPDEAYWVSHESVIRSKMDYDPAHDPPPDLVLEVEVSRTVLSRIDIFAALGVPEIWRWRQGSLIALLRQEDESYVESESSFAIPMLPVDELAAFVNRIEECEETTLIREFRQWVRETFADRLPAE